MICKQTPESVEKALVGKTITGLKRIGKQIFVQLDEGLIYIHLGMTGRLLWNAEPGKHTRAILQFSDACLVFDDIRQFGRFEYFENVPDRFSKLGPDALTVEFDNFLQLLRRRKGRIKPVLLSQSFVRGLGNIYVDELLFASRVHPLTKVNRLSVSRIKRIHANALTILQRAIDLGGSSISDYVDGNGQLGSFQNQHKVYGRKGQPCVVCGGSIRRIIVGQRGTHYCAACQRV